MGKRRHLQGGTSVTKENTSAQWDREFLLGIIDNIPDAVFVKDAEGRYLISNKSHLRLLGRKNRTEILDKTVYELFPEQYAQGFDLDDKEVMRTGKSLLNREELMLDKSGRPHWMSTSKIPLKDARGNAWLLVGISRDITEIKRYQESLRQAHDRMENELAAARQVQIGLIPANNPDIPGIRLHGFYQPASEVGGDYLDYFPTPDGRWVLVIADVCGKGVAAALRMTMLRDAFRSEAVSALGAKDLLVRVNRVMQPILGAGTFITVLCLVVEEEGRRLRYARAGHPPLLAIRRGAHPEPIQCGGTAIGLYGTASEFNASLEEVEIKPQSGNQYFLFSDGLVETLNRKKETYGMRRLSRILARRFYQDPERIIQQVVSDARRFRDGAPIHDDLTLLALEAPT